jgi:mannose-1-phosphate guanylyltransferase
MYDACRVKAVILAGGEGTRLRPLTLTTPKPVVPIVDRPFLRHQLDLLARAGIEDIIFSLAYRPERIQAVFGDGRALGKRIHYAVEETPLGTGGAVRNAFEHLDGTTVVFNGDVLTDVDLPALIRMHRASGAVATLVLAPVDNPTVYGVVETDDTGRVRRFVEKPPASEVTTNNINAGIYVLEKAAIEKMPAGVTYSIERSFFPGLLAAGDLVRAHVHRGYWIDIGTPEKYLQVQRDILHGRFAVDLDAVRRAGGWVHPDADVREGAELTPPFYIGPRCRVATGAAVGPDAVLVEDVELAVGAGVSDSVVWRGSSIGEDAQVKSALLGAGVRVGRSATVGAGAVLGEGAVLSDYSRTA